jgi:probable HAF family extracellular repeat protein
MNELTVDDSMCRSRREDGPARFWAVARKLALGVSLALACQSALAQVMYRIRPLGTIPGGCTYTSEFPRAAGLNDAGQVAGYVCKSNGHGSVPHAFLWKHDGTPMVDLGGSSSRPSVGTALNESGLATGYSDSGGGDSFAFVSSGDGAPMTPIYDGLGGNNVKSYAINDSGQLTGEAAVMIGVGPYHAFVWKNDGSPMLDLGTLGGLQSRGIAINASGQVAGSSEFPGVSGETHAFVWKNDGSPMLDLGTLGGTADAPYSASVGINAAGQVAGNSSVPGAVFNEHAFFWRNDGSPIQDLGTLGGSQSIARALNESGQVVGESGTAQRNHSHAFVWLNNGTPLKDLGNFGGPDSWAFDINFSGQVTGMASFPHGPYHAYIWRNDGTNIHDLNKLIDPTDPLKPYVILNRGDFINDESDILAEGVDSRTGLTGLYLVHGTVLALTPRSLAFGSIPINTTSAVKSVVVKNTSSQPVTMTSTTLTGAAAGQFAYTDNCGQSLAGHASCKIQVTFSPTTKGAKSAKLNVNGGGGGLTVVKLAGTGT